MGGRVAANPEAMRSDNGSPFASRSAIHGLSRLSAWWVALGINLERGRPGHPQDNGAHERLHRDISRELECFNQEITQEALDLWRHEFNYQRPHESLAMRCPGELYHNSNRKYAGSIDELLYESMLSRQVNQSGQIRWKRAKPLSESKFNRLECRTQKHRKRRH